MSTKYKGTGAWGGENAIYLGTGGSVDPVVNWYFGHGMGELKQEQEIIDALNTQAKPKSGAGLYTGNDQRWIPDYKAIMKLIK